MKKFVRHSRSGFTLIELLVGMTIFSMALTSIYLLLTSTMKSVNYSRNEIIVSNLLREQIELVRNVRDSNLAKGAGWDVVKIGSDAKIFEKGVFTVENNFTSTGTYWDNSNVLHSSTIVNKIDDTKISEWDVANLKDDSILKKKFEATQLCFDEQTRYVHCADNPSRSGSGTIFASYVNIFPMEFKDSTGSTQKIVEDPSDSNSKNQWYIVDARVIVRDGSNYREYDAKTAITDWQR